MKKTLYSGLFLLGTLMLGGCQADMDTPALEIPESTLTANMSILELKEKYENQTAQIDEDIVIKGRVISSDASGNIYKSLVIQDETAAMAFSLNQSSMYVTYRLGQEVLVNMKGLYIGYYRGLQQIGAPGEPYSGNPQLGFMAYDIWTDHSQMNGLPDPDCEYIRYGVTPDANKMHCFIFNSLDEINTLPLMEMQSQLVELRNVSFEGAGELNFSDYQESANRTLIDANGATLTVRNSGYSNFYNDILPKGTGRVRGILSYYGDSWQLILRDRADVMITEDGQFDKPYSIEQLQDPENDGLGGWTKGYIVGSVKGVSVVSSEADVIFGKDAEMDNNVLIAASPDETDYTKCAIVELPNGTRLRALVNLADNPGVYKKELMVKGTIGSFLGLQGIVNSNGSRDDFYLDGEQPSTGAEAPDPAGSGTESDPYNISFVMQSTTDYDAVWVEGYIAGYVTSGDFGEETCEFSASEVSGSSNYLNSTNVLLSAVAYPNFGCANSVPCQLTSTTKQTLGLRNNPSIFGQKVKVKCNIKDYLGVRGIRNITDVVTE